MNASTSKLSTKYSWSLLIFTVFTCGFLSYSFSKKKIDTNIGNAFNLEGYFPLLKRQANPENQASSSNNLLLNFQVSQPPVVPKGGRLCRLNYLQHIFGNSFGQPAKGQYRPPSDCGPPGSWASVVLELTVTSKGTQFDRLSSIFLNNIEILRTSTAEPTPEGIIWRVQKDITKYMPILALSKADLVMRLDNIVDEKQGIDGEFVVNLDMAFYMPTDQFPAPARASAILPLSHTNATVFSIPKPATVMVQLPESTSSAFVEIYASGSAEEEFWYTNLLDEGKEILTQNAPKSSVNARGPFREVQLWIDDKLAGVAYPFPVVFTGGILLSWWRPISAYGSFDQPTYTIDITPFLPILTDSKKHNFTLTVEGQGPDRSTNPQWFVSGNIAIALDPSGKRTTGKILKYTNDGFVRPSGDVCQSGFFSSVDAQRKISITSTIVTGKGENFEITCTQDFQFQNKQLSETTGASQSLTQLATGSSSSQIGTVNTFFDQFSFPFSVSVSRESAGLKGDIGIGYNRAFRPAYYNGIPTSIQANQTATGNLLLGESGRATGGISTTGQTISYSDARGETYQRDVLVTNVTTVLKDVLSGSLANQELSTRPNQFIAQSRQLYSKPVNKSEGHKKRETLISRSEPMRLPSGLMVDRTREWQN